LEVVAVSTSFNAVFEEVEGGRIQAQLEELPGVVTVGRTRAEAREMLLDAFHEYLLASSDPGTITSGADRERLVFTLS
jgi:predicted RNase H-like HicB family nuclease